MARNLSMKDAINEALDQEMAKDPTVIVMGEDIVGGSGSPGEDDAWGGVFQPVDVARVPVVLAKAPEDKPVVLVVSAGLVAVGPVELAFFRREVAGQADGALVVEPGFQRLFGPFVVAPAVEIAE